MHLTLDPREKIARLISDLAIGVPVVIRDGARKALAVAAETVDPNRFAAMRQAGAAHLAITARRADVLKAMVYDGDLARLVLPDAADLGWVQSVADPSTDLNHAMKGPFRALRGGDAELERVAIDLCKKARLLPAALVLPFDGPDPEAALSITIDDARASVSNALHHIAAARVPLSGAKTTRVHVFGSAADFTEHYAVEIGQPDRDAPVLCRLHSACFTGDIIGSLKCDCGPQLDAALAQIKAAGSGVLLYLNQEGRGIGLANKMRAYALQDQGFDTVDANHRLGFEDDERNLRIGADILREMGFSATRLMTNNPRKVDQMQAAGIDVVERVPHQHGAQDLNSVYLATKASKSGHLL